MLQEITLILKREFPIQMQYDEKARILLDRIEELGMRPPITRHFKTHDGTICLFTDKDHIETVEWDLEDVSDEG